jgi:hypothetical protein
MIILNKDIFSTTVHYLFPWEARIMLCLSESIQHVMKNENMIESIDQYNLTKENKSKFVRTCHPRNICSFWSPHLQQTLHDCNDTRSSFCNGGGGGVCHQNNKGCELFHWDSANVFQPYKCAHCGNIYITSKICEKFFFLNKTEIRTVLTSYVLGLKIVYRFQEVRWLALLKNKTVYPTYRWNNQRSKREGWLNRFIEDEFTPYIRDNFNDFIDVDTLVESTCVFDNFRKKGKTIRDLRRVFNCLRDFLPHFYRLFNELETNACIFPRMAIFLEKFKSDHFYLQAYLVSVEYCIDIAMREGELSNGLKTMRRIAYNHFRDNDPSLITCSEVLLLSFLDGEKSLEEFLQQARLDIGIKRRRFELHRSLNRKGIMAHSINCSVFDAYTRSETGITEDNVFDCIVHNHVLKQNFDDCCEAL